MKLKMCISAAVMVTLLLFIGGSSAADRTASPAATKSLQSACGSCASCPTGGCGACPGGAGCSTSKVRASSQLGTTSVTVQPTATATAKSGCSMQGAKSMNCDGPCAQCPGCPSGGACGNGTKCNNSGRKAMLLTPAADRLAMAPIVQ